MSEIERNTRSDFYNKVANLLKEARKSVVQTVNRTMVYTYFEIGRMIVEEEQKGKERAEYGKQIIKELSKRLISEFGKGFSTTNLKQMRQFYLTYSKSQTLSDQFEKLNFQLSWSHYLFLMKIDNPEERKFYEIEAISNGWSLRELQRQFDTALFERLVLSRDKKGVKVIAGKVLKMNNMRNINNSAIMNKSAENPATTHTHNRWQ